MDRGVGSAARLLPEGDRKDLAIQALAGSETVSDLAARYGVSRKFVYQQTRKVHAALDGAFSSAKQDTSWRLPSLIRAAFSPPVWTSVSKRRRASSAL